MLRNIPEHLRRYLTWDQGTEMAEHHAVSQATGMPVFFCDPGSPWQRPTSENTNGLLRQYFPKGTGLSSYTPADPRRVERELNNRPRKSLGGRAPAEGLRRAQRTIGPPALRRPLETALR